MSADVRAPTPTKAAELVVPKYSDLLAQLADLTGRLLVGMRRSLEQARTHLRSAERGLPRAEDLVRLPRQRFDAVDQRLGRALLANTRAHGLRQARVGARLQPRLLTDRLARLRDRLAALDARQRDGLARLAASRRSLFEGAAGRLRPTAILQRSARGADQLAALDARRIRSLATAIARGRQRLDARAQMLSALSYQGVLARGFAIVRDGNGAMVRRAQDVAAGAALGIEFHDGEVRVQAIEDGQDSRRVSKPPVAVVRPSKPRDRTPGGAAGGGQGTLF